jgi:hypothetical protein
MFLDKSGLYPPGWGEGMSSQIILEHPLAGCRFTCEKMILKMKAGG